MIFQRSSDVVVTLLLFSLDVSYLVFAYVGEPYIQDVRNGHTLVGEDIMIECVVSSNKPELLIEWDSPLNLKLTTDRVNIKTSADKINSKLYTIRSSFVIKEAKLEDSRIYYCRVADIDNIYDNKYAYIWIPVYNQSEHYIKFYNDYTSFDKVNKEVKVFVNAHPEPAFYWFDTRNQTIEPNSSIYKTQTKYSNFFANYEVILKFSNISNEDFGNYTLVAQNEFERKNLTVSVNISKPSSSITVIKSKNSSDMVQCRAIGYPTPEISWQFSPCTSLSCFSSSDQKTTPWEISEEDSEIDGLEINSYVPLQNNDTGIVSCVSNNSLGESISEQYVYNVDGFEIYAQNIIQNGSVTKIEALFRENVEIICAVSLRDYYKEIKWYRAKNNMSLDDLRIPIRGFDEHVIKNIDAVYSSISKVRVNIDKTDQDTYFCKATRRNGTVDSRSIEVLAKEQPLLNVASNMQNKTMEAKIGTIWRFYCNVDGYPKPSIKWFKNNKTIETSKRMRLKDNNQTLTIHNLQHRDNGTYKCVTSNRLNQTVSKIAFLKTIEIGFDWLLLGIILLSIVLGIMIIFFGLKMYKDYKINKELREAGLYNFEKGAVENLNPKLPLEDQANLLPYDKKWEIPAENLTLGKELGSGAFGVVYQGELRGIPTDQDVTTVAVKSVNKFADYHCVKALASELKIMAHLGKHVNVVNLIGACTKDIIKKKLLVVVEYCPYGNLHEYILHNSKSFVDLRNQEIDQFDWNLITKESEPKKSPTKLNYSSLSFSRSDDSGINFSKNLDDTPTKIIENNGQNDTRSISSKNLLTWAFQVAKGMEYLASHRVLHGDLAARNILLGENNVVKISDFGLARSLYKDDVYQKKEKGPLPVKWMAIESIGENIFSTQSDVWSFGVVLWEFFSLAKTPYPGMQVDQTFYKLLFSGYRMEQPEYSTHELYQLMLDCWNAEPMLRPTFTGLAEKIASLLEESIVNHYLNMNGPYVEMNQQTNNQDYLLMMSPPTFENIVPDSNYANNIHYFHSYQNEPRYVNNPSHKSVDRHNKLRSSL